MDWQFKRRSKRQSQWLIGVHNLNAVNICDEDIKHGDLITELLATLLNHHCYFTVLFQSLYRFVINQFNDRLCSLLRPIRISWMVIDRNSRVSKLQLGVDIRVNMPNRVWWYQIHVSPVLMCRWVLINDNLELWCNFECSIDGEPILVTAVLRWVLDCKVCFDLSITFLACTNVNHWTIEISRENSVVIVSLVVTQTSALLSVATSGLQTFIR